MLWLAGQASEATGCPDIEYTPNTPKYVTSVISIGSIDTTW